MVNYTERYFFNIEPALHPQNKLYLVTVYNYSYILLSSFANIWAQIFVPVFMKDICV